MFSSVLRRVEIVINGWRCCLETPVFSLAAGLFLICVFAAGLSRGRRSIP
jgi:hypothetical protein